MLWAITGTTLAFVAISTTFGGLGTGLLALAATVWLLFAFRPVTAGALVADWTRRRFE